MYSIYVLIDPRDDAVRYVGLTNDVYARFSQHLRCDSSNISKNVWVQELKDANVMLIMRTIDTVETLEQAREREQSWIKHHLSNNCSLLNVDGTKSITFNQFMSFFADNEEKELIETEVEDGEYEGAAVEDESNGKDKELQMLIARFPGISEWLQTGKKGVSVEEIMAATGLSKRTIYRRVTDKTLIKTKKPGTYRVQSVIKFLRSIYTSKRYA